MRPAWPSRRSLCAAALAISACGRGRSPAPTAATTPDPSIPAGTVVAVRSGETDQPQPATVVVAGRSYATDAAGEVRLAGKVNPGAFLDVIGPNVLDRQTLLRSSGETRFTVWPRTRGSAPSRP
jgi:hypothetical protein